MNLSTDVRLTEKLSTYEGVMATRIQQLRDLIIDTARSLGIEQLEETVKWGEPAFVTARGSTFRLDARGDQYCVFFHCQSRLVPTFRKVFGDVFTFDGDRAIVFEADEEPPEAELRRCFAAALRYHDVKQLPELGL